MTLCYFTGDELEKIVKSVMVRSADGKYRERGLSQLSGGQWRRVSMALDLAFAEIIRRKGTLRCNLIVMDEVLTHLDSAGREAVGSVLRAMVDGSRGQTQIGSQGEGQGVGLGAFKDMTQEGGSVSGSGSGSGNEGIDLQDVLMNDEVGIDIDDYGVSGRGLGLGQGEKALRGKAEALERSRALIGTY